MQTVTMSKAYYSPFEMIGTHQNCVNGMDYGWCWLICKFRSWFRFRSDRIGFEMAWYGMTWHGMVWPGMPWWRLHLFVIIHAFVCDFNDCIWFMSFDVQSFLARFRKALFCWSPNGQSAANAHSFSISTEASNFCWFLCLLSLVSCLSIQFATACKLCDTWE